MTKPLTVKRPGIGTMPGRIGLGILFIGPIAGLSYCLQAHRAVHVQNPALNLGIYLAVYLIPLLWALIISYPKFQFEETDEILLGTCSTFQKWPLNWWTMFVMWAAPVFAIFAGIHDLLTDYLPHPENLSLSVGHAFLIMLVVLCLGMFYFALLFGRNDYETRLAPEGLRMSLMRFHQWVEIHHVSQREEFYSVYHRANPALPAGTVKVHDEAARALLLKALADHQIPLSNAVDPQLTRIKFAVVGGFLALLIVAQWLQGHTGLTNLWIVVITFAGGIAFTIVLERIRGIQKYAKYKPIIAPVSTGGDSTEATVVLK